MFKDSLPDKKIGYLSLRTYIENQAYEFYRLAPPGIMLVLMPCGLRDHTAKEVKRVVKSFDSFLDPLIARNVDIILQAGLPIPLLLGPKGHDALIHRIEDYTGRPAVSQLQNVIAAMKSLNLRNVLVANRWTDRMNTSLTEFLARDEISVAAVFNHVMAPSESHKMKSEETAQMAYDMALAGFRENPEADGLYLGGNAWLAQPVVERLEAETGKPVICNNGATLWDLLRRLGKWRPMPGRGFLLEQH